MLLHLKKEFENVSRHDKKKKLSYRKGKVIL